MDEKTQDFENLEDEIKAFESLRLRSSKSSSVTPKGDLRLNPMNVDLIVKKLLSYLPLHELKSAREVNRNWNQLASQFFYPYCSKVTLSFNDDNFWTNARNYGIDEMKDFIHLVQMSQQCPFTSFDIGTSIISRKNEETVAEFFQICGSFMQELTIREDCGKRFFRNGMKIDLDLKELEVLQIHLLQACPDILDDFFKFINEIVRAATNLKQIILLSHHGFDNGEAVTCLIGCLLICDTAKITHLKIEAQMSETHLIMLSNLGLSLQHLSMDFWGSRIPTSFGINTFLTSQSNSLETFKLSDVAMSSLCVVEFPCMHKLENLQLKGSMLGRISVTFPSISFKDQFPKLKSLKFADLFGEWEDFLKSGMKPSKTLEDLKLPSDFTDAPCLRRVAFIFPNLKKLELVSNPNLINVVYELMPNLEELTINTRYVSLIDDIITGIPNDICLEINRERCYDLVLKELETYQTARSITCLKKLKTLKLKCRRASDPAEITEVSFYLALFHMKNLVSVDFGLRPLMLSRECMEQAKQQLSVISLHLHQ